MTEALSALLTARGRLEKTWLPALRRARMEKGTADVLWFGDSLSELDPMLDPMPWIVGRVLSRWREPVQYRNGGAEFTSSMATTGRPSDDDDAGLGGRSVDLDPGQSSTIKVNGRAVTVVWTRQPDGGSLRVVWGSSVDTVIDTRGDLAHSRLTLIEHEPALLPEDLTITAEGASARLEGVYVHNLNAHTGVRVWPAVRSGNKAQHFLDRPGWGLEAIGTIDPDLVVIATGTNTDTDYATELDRLITAVRERSPEVDIAVWVPFLNPSFEPHEAAAGRKVAAERGCALIDAAAALGVPATVDRTHSDSTTTSIAAAQLAVSLSDDPLATLCQIAGEAAVRDGHGQSWYVGAGRLSIENVIESGVLSGRARTDDTGYAWAIFLPELAVGLGLPGSTLAFGPGRTSTDTHLSRAGHGRFTVNGGTGELELGRLLLTSPTDAPPDPPGSGAALFIEASAGGAAVAAQLPDGTVHRLLDDRASAALGLVLPLPCTFAAPVGPPSTVDLVDGEVTWIPLPALASPAEVTHAWLDVVDPGVGDAATVAVAEDAEGLPGRVVVTTSAGAIDLGAAGVAGAELLRPVVLHPGRTWWVAVHVTGPGNTGLRGGMRVEGRSPVHLGTEPARPGAASGGGLVASGLTAVPDPPQRHQLAASGPVPEVHLSVRRPAGP